MRVLHRPSIVALALASVPVIAAAAQVPSPFQDIPAGHWARRAATVLAAHQILPGRTPVDFAGETPLNRYELAWALSHLYNVDGPPASFVVLSDMPPGHPATLEVQRAMGFGLLPSRKPGRFEGDQPATRQDVVESLDVLLNKDGVEPPARKTAVVFPDVPPEKPFGQAVDRVVNRFGLLDARQGVNFNPKDSITRYQFLSMLTRAVKYLQPPIWKEIQEPPPTPPPASLPPGASPVPTPEGSPGAEVSPGTGQPPTPVTQPSGAVLHTRAIAQAEVLGLFSENLPTDPGLVTAGEQRAFSGNGLPGGGAAVEVWTGTWGGTLGVSSYFVGLTVPKEGDTNLLDTMVHVEGLYEIVSSPDLQFGLGLAGAYRQTYNLTGVGSLYLTADKTYLGAGPALVVGTRFSPTLALAGGLDAYPSFQSYNLPGASRSITRWEVYPHARLEYNFAGSLLGTLGVSATINGGGGGMQTIIGLSAGIGTGF